jgi:tetratricopeptide (TPR) repeat protein
MWFLKKRKKNAREIVIEPVKALNKGELLELIKSSKAEIKSAEGDQLVGHLNKIGKLYFEMEEIDKSIEYYERSLAESNALGQAFKDLVKLYNIKRQEATRSGNNDDVQIYFKKTDDLMQLSKDVIRGKM